MSVIEMPDLIQGTDEWHDQRRGMVTASVVGRLVSARPLGASDYACPSCGAEADQPCISKVGRDRPPIKTMHAERTALSVAKRDESPLLIGPADTDEARGLTALLAAERITGHTDPTWVNADMWRGIEDEPRAVAVYSEHYAPVATTGFMVRDDWGFQIGYSPDGLVGKDGLIEAKSRRQKTQLLTILADEVPAANMAQLQCGLLVSERKWCDYLSYCGGMPMYVKRVFPDERWFAAIVEAVAMFEETVEAMVADYRAASSGLPMTERVLEEMVI